MKKLTLSSSCHSWPGPHGAQQMKDSTGKKCMCKREERGEEKKNTHKNGSNLFSHTKRRNHLELQCCGASEARSRGGNVIIMWPELNHGRIWGCMAELCWSAGMGGNICWYFDNYIPSPSAHPQPVCEIKRVIGSRRTRVCVCGLSSTPWPPGSSPPLIPHRLTPCLALAAFCLIMTSFTGLPWQRSGWREPGLPTFNLTPTGANPFHFVHLSLSTLSLLRARLIMLISNSPSSWCFLVWKYGQKAAYSCPLSVAFKVAIKGS